MDTDTKAITRLRNTLIENVLQIESSYLNGHPEKRLCNNAHFRITGIEGESILLALNEKGIAASTGSACSSKKLQASHVLTALGLNPEEVQGSIRLSLGRKTTGGEISYVSTAMEKIVGKLRQMSPLWNQ
jgi:cysteine desulfurase